MMWRAMETGAYSRMWAAALYGGERATVSGPAAAFRHGMLRAAPDVVDVTLSDARVLRVYGRGTTPNRTCYEGGQAPAQKLRDDLAGLLVKYYPSPFA